MKATYQARASARALLTRIPLGVAAGGVIGLALGGAYMAGGLAKDAGVQAKVVRIAAAADGDFSQAGLESLAATDPKALAFAMRLDPSLMADVQSDERQTAELSQELSKRAPKSNFFKASVSSAVKAFSGPAARPWTASPLDAARQLDCLTQAVYYEARGETPAGQAAVAQVVLNRVRHPQFPKSVCAVVYQGATSGRGCQFSFACNGATRYRREGGAWERAERIASRAMDGYVMADVGNATHFHVASINPRWGNLLRVGKIGMHVFYRFSGKAGSPAAFIAEPEPAPEETHEPVAILASMTIVPADSQSPVITAANAVVDTMMRADTPAAQAAPAKPETSASPAPSAAKPS